MMKNVAFTLLALRMSSRSFVHSPGPSSKVRATVPFTEQCLNNFPYGTLPSNGLGTVDVSSPGGHLFASHARPYSKRHMGAAQYLGSDVQ